MRFGSGALLLLKIDPSSRVPLFRQIYEELRQRMLDRRLRQGSRLPSTRALSADLRVARSTVVQAFEQLQMDDRILFATDYPHWDFDTPKIVEARLPDAWREGVMQGNARALYGLPDREPAGTTT